MCLHPRCGQASVYRLEGTDYGPKMDLCAKHGFEYQRAKGGMLRKLIDGELEEIEDEK